jgi:hypothetical protein
MLAELVLVTRLLGLLRGDYPVTIQVDPKVARVDLLRDGQIVTTVKGAPWQALINFGEELVPQELTAIAYDANGAEVGRDTQLVNLPRPAAEASIDLRREANGLRATVRWQHIASANIRHITWKLDGKDLGGDAPTVMLPPLEAKNLHVVEAAVTFRDGVVARHERVFGGVFTEEVPTELTGVVVRQGAGAVDLARCFSLRGDPVPATAVELGDSPIVMFVRNPDGGPARYAFGSLSRGGNANRFDLASDVRIIWPNATAIVGKETRSVTNLFEHTQIISGKRGTYELLTGGRRPRKIEHRYADAVAVAGLRAALGARRRAVVLVLGSEKDQSRLNAPLVKRYLERIGVPLQVWSLLRSSKTIAAVWGDVVDVSDQKKLQRATAELQRELDEQRVAWLPLKPLDALKVETAEDCALDPIARP